MRARHVLNILGYLRGERNQGDSELLSLSPLKLDVPVRPLACANVRYKILLIHAIFIGITTVRQSLPVLSLMSLSEMVEIPRPFDRAQDMLQAKRRSVMPAPNQTRGQAPAGI